MIIGERLRALREEKKFSQGDIEKRTGLIRCYVSRVENGLTIPAVETLEKFAHALEVPMYQLFYDGEEPPKLPNLPKRKTADDSAWGSKGRTHECLRSSAGCSAAWKKAIWEWCCSWRRKWRGGRLFEPNGLEFVCSDAACCKALRRLVCSVLQCAPASCYEAR